MQQLLQVAAFAAIVALGSAAVSGDESTVSRQDSAKLFSAFQLVRFPNDACVGSNSRNGTCYTAEECTTKGGTSGGSCASGFGVCCTFSVSCGGSSMENVTYWDSTTTVNSGSCAVQICKTNDNICQLRLDFTNFVITGPSTVTTTTLKEIGGIINSVGSVGLAPRTACITDIFTVTTDAGKRVPRVCGTLSGEHMYVPASKDCNTLAFHFGDTVRGVTSFAARSWKIKVTQYACDFENLPPEGCTQYYFGATSGSVKSFNFDGATHLDNQDQKICFRQEKGICRMCFANAVGDFKVAGATANMGVVALDNPCHYGTDGAGTEGFDCVIVPGASQLTGKVAPSMQGGDLGFVIAGALGAAVSVCTRMTPFHIEFLTDGYEVTTEKGSAGFRIAYANMANSC